ncbi:MAG: hypothetical protein Q9184_000743 [Pyrenodesmia sp. 2 TL-2023]
MQRVPGTPNTRALFRNHVIDPVHAPSPKRLSHGRYKKADNTEELSPRRAALTQEHLNKIPYTLYHTFSVPKPSHPSQLQEPILTMPPTTQRIPPTSSQPLATIRSPHFQYQFYPSNIPLIHAPWYKHSMYLHDVHARRQKEYQNRTEANHKERKRYKDDLKGIQDLRAYLEMQLDGRDTSGAGWESLARELRNLVERMCGLLDELTLLGEDIEWACAAQSVEEEEEEQAGA